MPEPFGDQQLRQSSQASQTRVYGVLGSSDFAGPLDMACLQEIERIELEIAVDVVFVTKRGAYVCLISCYSREGLAIG